MWIHYLVSCARDVGELVFLALSLFVISEIGLDFVRMYEREVFLAFSMLFAHYYSVFHRIAMATIAILVWCVIFVVFSYARTLCILCVPLGILSLVLIGALLAGEAIPNLVCLLVVYTSCIQEMWFKKGDETLKYMTDKAFKKEINKCGLCRSSHILALMDER